MKLVGNGPAATVGIFLFIIIMCLLFWRHASAAEVDLRVGSSFGQHGSYGPVLGFRVLQPLGNDVSLAVGTNLWGSTGLTSNNWNWDVGFQSCRWARFCAGIGAAYVQRIDAFNGAHTNYVLGLAYKIGWRRISSIDITHLSDAGTTPVNTGRQALMLAIDLQP